jgi:hypothetical protein
MGIGAGGTHREEPLPCPSPTSAVVASSSFSPYDAGGYTEADEDTVENRLKREVCAGDLSLAGAHRWIVNDWRDAP